MAEDPIESFTIARGSLGFVTFAPTPCNWLTFGCGIRINTATGEVVIPDGMKLSAAAREFWTAVQMMAPGSVPTDRRGFGT